MPATTTKRSHGRRDARTLFLFIACATAATASAQYTIDSFTIDSGGAEVAAGGYSLTGTIGQPDASAPVSAGAYTLTGGFWPRPAGGPTNDCFYDTNNDGTVDIIDFGAFGSAFNSMTGDANYDPAIDVNSDGLIDIIDFGSFGSEFNRADCLSS